MSSRDAARFPWWTVAAALAISAVAAAHLKKSDRNANARQTEEALRAAEPGRGRQTDSPLAIPASGWKDILLRTYNDFSQDRLSYVSGGVAFFILVAFVPGLTAFISLYGLLAEPATVRGHLTLLQGLIPPDAFSLVGGEIERIA